MEAKDKKNLIVGALIVLLIGAGLGFFLKPAQFVEKIVEKPVEKIVEKPVEKIVEVPSTTTPPPPGRIVLYSGRREELMRPSIEAFEKKTGIQVLIKAGSTSELANAILEERNSPRADVYIGTDPGALETLRREGVLEPYLSPAVKAIPEAYRASDGAWVGVSGRARVIMYNKNLVSESELPKSLFELTDSKWKGKVAMASTREGTVVAHLSAIYKVKGEAFLRQFLEDLKRNEIKVLRGHTDVRKAVGNGEVALGWVNHYYYHLQLKEGSPVGVVYPDQGANDVGTMISVAGVAIVKGARNLDGAKAFVDFLASPEAQDLFAKTNYEYPLIAGIAPFEAKPMEEFKKMDVRLEELSDVRDAVLKLVDAVGLVA